MPVADRVVVGVEKGPECRMVRTVARQTRLEQESLEKPAGVREMPLDRARVGHRLNRAVLVGKRDGQRFGRGADGAVSRRQRTASRTRGAIVRRCGLRVMSLLCSPGCRACRIDALAVDDNSCRRCGEVPDHGGVLEAFVAEYRQHVLDGVGRARDQQTSGGLRIGEQGLRRKSVTAVQADLVADNQPSFAPMRR